MITTVLLAVATLAVVTGCCSANSAMVPTEAHFNEIHWWTGGKLNVSLDYVKTWKPWVGLPSHLNPDGTNPADWESNVSRRYSNLSPLEIRFEEELNKAIGELRAAIRSVKRRREAEAVAAAELELHPPPPSLAPRMSSTKPDNDLWQNEFVEVFSDKKLCGSQKEGECLLRHAKTKDIAPAIKQVKILHPIRAAFNALFPPSTSRREKALSKVDQAFLIDVEAEVSAGTDGENLIPRRWVAPYFGSFKTLEDKDDIDTAVPEDTSIAQSQQHNQATVVVDSGDLAASGMNKIDSLASSKKKRPRLDLSSFAFESGKSGETHVSRHYSPLDNYLVRSPVTLEISSYAQLYHLIQKLGTVFAFVLPAKAESAHLSRFRELVQTARESFRKRPIFVLSEKNMPDQVPQQWVVQPKNERVVVLDGEESAKRIMTGDPEYVSFWEFEMVRSQVEPSNQPETESVVRMVTNARVMSAKNPVLLEKGAPGVGFHLVTFAITAMFRFSTYATLLPPLTAESFQFTYLTVSRHEEDSRQHAVQVAKTQRLCRRAVKSSRKSRSSASSSSASTFKSLHKYVDRCFNGVVFAVVADDAKGQCKSRLLSAARSRQLARQIGNGSPFEDNGQRHFYRIPEPGDVKLKFNYLSLATHNDRVFYRNLVQGSTGMSSLDELAVFSSTLPAEEGCRVLMIVPAMGVVKPLWFSSPAQLSTKGVPLMQLNNGLFTLLAWNNEIGSGSDMAVARTALAARNNNKGDNQKGNDVFLQKNREPQDTDAISKQLTVPRYFDDGAADGAGDYEEGDECLVALHVVTSEACAMCHRLSYVLLPALSERLPWLPIEVYDRRVLLGVASGSSFELMTAADGEEQSETDKLETSFDDAERDVMQKAMVAYLARRVTDQRKLPTPAVLVQIVKVNDHSDGPNDKDPFLDGSEGDVYVYSNKRWDDAQHLARFVRRSLASAGCRIPIS